MMNDDFFDSPPQYKLLKTGRFLSFDDTKLWFLKIILLLLEIITKIFYFY